MRKMIIVSLVMVFAAVTMAIAAQQPDKVHLKQSWNVEGRQPAVIFDHSLHAGKETCTACHATADGAKVTFDAQIKGNNDRNPAHAYCWPCHAEKSVPRGRVCATCHAR